MRSDAVERRRLARRCRGGFLRLVGRLGGLGRLAGERLGLGRRGRDGLRLRHEQRRMGELDRLGVVGEMITRIPIRVLSNSFSAKPKGIRTQPCEAAYPGSGPPCSATPFQVMRCMFGIQASS